MFISKTVYEELLNRIDNLEKQVKEAKWAYDNAVYEARSKASNDVREKFEIIDKFLREERDKNDKRYDNRIEDKFEELESELDSKIEKAINGSNIEDKVLLKVVKATFNNWSEE